MFDFVKTLSKIFRNSTVSEQEGEEIVEWSRKYWLTKPNNQINNVCLDNVSPQGNQQEDETY